ncbi:hypothetical protein CH063_01234 [Colletotrichum higginsianum]|uniref:N-acetylglucosamine-induced protein 1 n=2 Tax=Colletotrichum higginsianum TaxID=80884 RepID=H1V477_COLHI|nr:hypothetical protein CH63R_01792 [Colletotrichum higginsianum IMI 349063]OBR13066.1 hypothetical protein CH63R_01792 [Colletotrichum higginsianum IMI 349063]TID02253.1 N-acetylglucosamine-induced protein 1 [Colletotrichum higginsianum]CCF35029.1 hypothetical protein CH063_01234 [Colletotrichum higginsianum]
MDIETLIMHAPFKLSDEDIRVLRGQSERLEPHTWDEVKGMIAAGEMGQLRRSPLDLRNYIRWHAEIGKTHGSVLEYVRHERLHWPKHIIARDAVPFAHANDWKIIWNDWPYDLADGMMHLVIWSKSRTAVDPETGLPTDHTAKLIESFLDRTFGETLGCRRGQDLLWFKQKTAWQSVKALEHIHVLLRNVPEERVEKLVGQRRSQTLRALVGESMASIETRISSKMS